MKPDSTVPLATAPRVSRGTIATNHTANRYCIELYDGNLHPATTPRTTDTADTLRDAQRVAARLLGHGSLRGASTWERYQGGTVYQFGPRVEDNGYDYVIIRDLVDEREAERIDRRGY